MYEGWLNDDYMIHFSHGEIETVSNKYGLA